MNKKGVYYFAKFHLTLRTRFNKVLIEMSVAIRIECHGEVVLEAAFNEDPANVPTVDPGPGTIKSNGLAK